MVEIYPIYIDGCVHSTAHLLPLLTEPEQLAARRLVSVSACRAYIVSHYALRVLLARTLGGKLADIKYQLTAQGKPELVGASVQFNLSHSGNRALVAISRMGAVGVDVEQCRPRDRLLRLADRFFADDEACYVRSAMDVVKAFYLVWTAKEAYLKALGVGLAGGLDRFSVVDSAGRFRSQVGEWQLREISLDDAYQACLVAEQVDEVRVQPMEW